MTVTTFEDAIIETRRRLEAADPFDAIVRFNFSDGSTYLADGTTTPPSIIEGGAATEQCTMSLSPETFIDLTNKAIKPPVAMMTGKVKIEGALLKAMKFSNAMG